MDSREQALKLWVKGLSYADIARNLKVSRQRVHQLVAPDKELREQVIEAAQGRCRKCGIFVGKSGHVHHKSVKVKQYNHSSNLLLVCPSCHMKLHNTGKVKPCDPRPKDPHAVALGRKGGLKSWAGRKVKLSPERRSEIARNAVNARWRKDRERQVKGKRKPR